MILLNVSPKARHLLAGLLEHSAAHALGAGKVDEAALLHSLAGRVRDGQSALDARETYVLEVYLGAMQKIANLGASVLVDNAQAVLAQLTGAQTKH